MKILVVDDEKLLVKGVKFNLENEGYEVTAAYDGAAAVELAKKENFDLIVMDVMMPGLSGSEACMQIREFSDVPIIMLTARSEDSDKLMGFACGADDYVTKPFSPAELTARVDALYRRSGGEEKQADSGEIFQPPFLLNTRNRTLEKNGKRIKLTQVEYSVIKLFMDNPGKALSRDEILESVWGRDYYGEVKIVDVNIRRLRMKVEDEPSHPAHILTVWGYGYRWEE